VPVVGRRPRQLSTTIDSYHSFDDSGRRRPFDAFLCFYYLFLSFYLSRTYKEKQIYDSYHSFDESGTRSHPPPLFLVLVTYIQETKQTC
jgi:hypothetical protein